MILFTVFNVLLQSCFRVSGLSPFMGDTDGDTLANIIRGDYDFDYQEFDDISDECQDLIQRLIVKDKR